MPEYTIQDAETGRELVVEGATPPTPEDMAFLFAEAYRREGGTPRPSDLVVPPDILPPVEEVVPEALPEAVSQPVDPEDELGMLGTFTGGASRGFSRLGSTFTDIIPAIAGSAVGNEEYALEQLAQAEEKRRLSELEHPTQFESYKEVEGVGDFSRFVSQVVGEQIGNIGLVVGTGLAAVATAPVSVPAGTALLAGTAFGSYALNAPEVFENIYQETGETAPGVALLFGAGAAALDSVLPYGVARTMSPGWKTGVVKTLLERSGMSPGVLRSGTAGLFAGLGVEGITEGGQEAISIAAERFVDDNPEAFGSREWDRIMESVVQGAIAGGVFGGVGGGIQGVRESNDAKKVQETIADVEGGTEVDEGGSVIDPETGDKIVPAESGAGGLPGQVGEDTILTGAEAEAALGAGEVAPTGGEGIVDTSFDFGANVEAEGAPTRPISNEWSELSGASENTLQQNLDLANAQQGVAETPMTQAQAAMGGTPLSGVIEHVGDLTNRMGPYHPLEYSYTETKAKINRALTALKSGYGFEREHNEALQGNAATRNVPYETLVENSNTALDRYADAHAQLETYAPIQTLARDAAVALGRRQFDQATQLLEELDSKIPTQEAYVAELLGRGEPAATPVDEVVPDVEESIDVGGPATPPNPVFATMRNARQAINYIKKNTSNKLFKNLANRLAPVMGNTRLVMVTDPETQIANPAIRDAFNTPRTRGVYDASGIPQLREDTIYVNPETGMNEEVILHEAIHKGTAAKVTIYLNNDPTNAGLTNKEVKALDKLNSLMEDAEAIFRAKERAGTLTQTEINLSNAGAFTNLYEFIAYGRTNEAMQEFLNTSPGTDGKSTLFAQFVEFLRQLFNIPASQKSAFMELVKASDTLMVPTDTATNAGQVLAAKKIGEARKKRVNKLQEAIRNATGGARGMWSNIGKLMKETRDGVTSINVLRGALEWMNENVVTTLSKILTTTDITRWIDDVIPGVHSINRDIQNFTKARNQALATLHERIQPWVKFAKDFAQEAKLLSEVMHESTILQVDLSAWATAEEAIANDEVLHGNNQEGDNKIVGKYEKLLDPEIHPLTKEDIKAEIQERIDDIERLYKKWNDVGKVDNKKGHEIYKMAKAAYRETYDKYHSLLIKHIEESSANEATRQKLIAFINLRYEVHHNLKVYFPLMRYGNYWITVTRPGRQIEFYMRESAADRNNLLDEIVTDLSGIDPTQDRAQHEAAKTQLFNDGVIEQGDKLREGFNKAIAGSTQDLKDLFATIDSLQEKTEKQLEGGVDNFTAADFDLLKDELYQMWLHTQQPDALRRKFIHRKRDNVLGYAEDALRNFVNSQATSANQLARFEFAPKLDRSIEAAEASLTGRAPSQGKQKYEILVNEIINRARRELNPVTPDGLDWGALASIGNQVAFVYMLTAPKSALIQFTQVPIIGIPSLIAKGYGKRNVMRVLGGYIKVLSHFGKEGMLDGTVSVVNSDYINNHPLSALLKAGFQTAKDLGILNVTYSADISARRKSDTDQFDSVGKKGWRGFVDMMGFLFHHSERLSREIVFMSTLELELERLQRNSPELMPEAALATATQKAVDTTYEILFNYTLYEKPPVMKNPVGKVATQFLTYPLQMTSFLVRNFFGTVWPTIPRAERKAAATKLFGTIGMTSLFAGLVGIPGYTAIMGMAEGVREALRPDEDDEDADIWYDENDEGNPLGKRNLDLWFREWWIPTMFGPDSDIASALGLTEEQAQLLARNVEMGPISALSDWNIGSSVTLDHLWFQDRVPSDDMKSAFQYFLFDTFGGPLGAMGSQIAAGVQDMNEGNFDRGWEKFAPAFFRGPLKALRVSQEGTITQGQRAQMLDAEWYTTGKLLGQALNFQSTTEAEISKANFLAKRVTVEVQKERTKVLNQINLAYAKDMENSTPRTQANIDEALDAVYEYNYRNGFYPISGDSISQSLTGRATTRAEAEQGLVVPQKDLAPWASDLVRRSRVR